MKLLKTKSKYEMPTFIENGGRKIILNYDEAYYSNTLRVTVNKIATEFIFPKMTLMQSKLFMFLMAQAKSLEGEIPCMVCSCKMLAKKILNCKVSDIPKFYDNAFFKSMTSMVGKQYNIYDGDKDKATYFSVFDHLEINMVGDEPYIKFDFGKTMKYVLIHTMENFSEINTEYVYKFKSVHSLWLYFFLCGKVYHDKNWNFSFPINQLSEILGVPQLADSYKEFNRSILKPAEKEVKEKSDIQVTHSKKHGAENIDFKCHRDKREKLDRKKLK